jgi:hypothetical protein
MRVTTLTPCSLSTVAMSAWRLLARCCALEALQLLDLHSGTGAAKGKVQWRRAARARREYITFILVLLSLLLRTFFSTAPQGG